MITLLWLRGHAGEYFEVLNNANRSSQVMAGRVRNWASLRKGAVRFRERARPRHSFAPTSGP